MIFLKEKAFGVIKVEQTKIKLYSSQSSYSTIHVGSPISEARWGEENLIVYLISGKVRIYKSFSNYTTIN